jgi:hypothetical protein
MKNSLFAGSAGQVASGNWKLGSKLYFHRTHVVDGHFSIILRRVRCFLVVSCHGSLSANQEQFCSHLTASTLLVQRFWWKMVFIYMRILFGNIMLSGIGRRYGSALWWKLRGVKTPLSSYKYCIFKLPQEEGKLRSKKKPCQNDRNWATSQTDQLS